MHPTEEETAHTSSNDDLKTEPPSHTEEETESGEISTETETSVSYSDGETPEVVMIQDMHTAMDTVCVAPHYMSVLKAKSKSTKCAHDDPPTYTSNSADIYSEQYYADESSRSKASSSTGMNTNVERNTFHQVKSILSINYKWWPKSKRYFRRRG